MPECFPQIASAESSIAASHVRRVPPVRALLRSHHRSEDGRVRPERRHAQRASGRVRHCCGGAGKCVPRSLVPAVAAVAARQGHVHRGGRSLRAERVHRSGRQGRRLPLARGRRRPMPAEVFAADRLATGSAAAEHLPGDAPLRALLRPDHGPAHRGVRQQRRHADRAAEDVPKVLRRHRCVRTEDADPGCSGADARRRHLHGHDAALRAGRAQRHDVQAADLPLARQRRGALPAELSAERTGAELHGCRGSTCPTTHKCAPCFDPTNGTNTSACGQNGDTPKEPPYTFPKCCNVQSATRGTCIPTSIAPPAAASLPQDSCPDTTWKCIPNEKVADESYRFPSCDAGLFGAGACMSTCFLAGQFGSFLLPACGASGSARQCAPCNTPFSNPPTPSGACQ